MPRSKFKFDNPDDAYREAQRRIAYAADSEATELDLRRLGLKSVPPEIGQLARLTTLSFNDNQLTSVSPEIGQLASLGRNQMGIK